MRNHFAHRLFPVCLFAMILGFSSAHAQGSFPFNGSFEMVSGGKPAGWDVKGQWFVRPDARVTGRNGISVLESVSKPGSLLTTAGYLRVQPGETLDLSFSYLSTTGQLSCGLIFCDSLGNPIATGAWEALPASCDWTKYQRQIVVPEKLTVDAPPARTPPVPAPAPAAPAADAAPAAPAADAAPATPPTVDIVPGAVRLVFRMDAEAVQLKLDDVQLAYAGTTAAMPLVPKIAAEQRPNLAPNPDLKCGTEGQPSGWSAVQPAGAELATLEPAGAPDRCELGLKSGDRAAAWMSEAVLVDGGMPYRVEAEVRATDVAAGQLQLVVELVDPGNDRAVWQQHRVDVPADQEGPVAFLLPRYWNDQQAVRARVGLMLQPGKEGSAALRAVALRPEPLTVSVRCAAVAGGFKSPADVQLFVSAVNNTYAVVRPKALLQVYDECGQAVTSETRPIVIGSRSAAYFPYRPKLTGTGAYTLKVTILDGSKELGAAGYDFSVGAAPTAATP
jgi:hypothetical protein